MNILVSGHLNIETTVSIEKFPIDYFPITYPSMGVNSNVSGVGCNVAKALKALGDNVDLVSYIGNDDDSERVLKDLERSGISTDNIIRGLIKTCASVILFAPDGRRQIYSDLKDVQNHTVNVDRLREKLKNVDAAAICNINYNRSLIKAAHEMGVLVATDVHVLSDINDNYNRDFVENADILFLSDEHLPCAAEEFIMRLYERYHNKVIVIGMGAKGALLLDSGRTVFVDAYKKSVVLNTVGAGDALFSSFLHFYTKGLTAEESLRRAVIFAGLKIGFNGASLGFSSESEIERLIRE